MRASGASAMKETDRLAVACRHTMPRLSICLGGVHVLHIVYIVYMKGGGLYQRGRVYIDLHITCILKYTLADSTCNMLYIQHAYHAY